ncbi:MAG TPA: acetyl-CoA carboxylase biotin carboxyl carrier protein subunit [Anaerolineales bacterium]|jgi:biotin carboxyl carrier protein
MKYNIKIGEKSFEVAIDDINKRPIVAHINGQEFLISPETNPLEVEAAAKPESHAKLILPTGTSLHDGVIVSPLPGTVIDVFVKAGDEIEAGQVILIIEAMKMKNSIRSTKDGIVAAVLVSTGQTVAHKQALLEFKE